MLGRRSASRCPLRASAARTFSWAIAASTPWRRPMVMASIRLMGPFGTVGFCASSGAYIPTIAELSRAAARRMTGAGKSGTVTGGEGGAVRLEVLGGHRLNLGDSVHQTKMRETPGGVTAITQQKTMPPVVPG